LGVCIKKSFKRNIFYSKEDSSSSKEEEYEPDTIQDENFIMALEQHKSDQEKTNTEECEVVVDMEGELIVALEKISRLEIKNRLRKEQLQVCKEKDNEVSEEIVILKIQLQEAKRREEILINQIKEKENICDKLEAEIVALRKDLEKSRTQMKFIKESETLDNILSNQRSPDDKAGLGYKESLKIVKGESSMSISTNVKPTSYANALKGNNNQPNKSKVEKKKHLELDQPNYANKHEARKQQVSESYQVGRQRPIPTSKFFIPRHPNFFHGYFFFMWQFWT
jgi:hypothetical protein